MPRSNSPEPKYNTLKPRRRKHRHSQFYSLRLCRKHEAAHRNFQVYAIPIYKSCPHKNGSTSTIATSVRSGECTPTSTLTRSSRETIKSEIIKTETIKTKMIKSERINLESFNLERISSERINSEAIKSTRKTTTTTTTIPPIPAPRTRKTNPIEHTYQNIPPPVFPEKSTTTSKLKVCHPLILFTGPSRSDTRKYCDRKVVLVLFTSHLYSVLAFISRLPGCASRGGLYAKLSVHYHSTCSNVRSTPVA